MREIKFRGKRFDNGEWVYGYYYCDKRLCDENLKPIPKGYIIEFTDEIDGNCNTWEVDPETVEQFTGSHDKNGKEIYEGDVVLATLKYFDIKNEKGKIIFHDGAFGVQFGFSTDYFKSLIAWDDIEIIGTIHDQKAEV